MRKFIIIILIFLSLFIIKIPKYVELNHIHIIEEISITCSNNSYRVSLKEIIPIKEDNGIEYKYQKYVKTGNSLKKIKDSFDDNKHFFYKDIRTIKSNCVSKEEIIKIFEIKKRKY